MIDLTSKTFLMMGAANALSKSAAQTIQRAGAEVRFIVPQGTLPLENHLSFSVDFNDPAALLSTLEQAGVFHGVIVSPGWYGFGDFLNSANDDWDDAIQQNFEQMVYAMQAAGKSLIAQQHGGRIIILSSVMSVMPFLQASAFGVSLSALWAVAKMAAVDLGVYDITVNIVASGWIEAEWSAPYLHSKGREFVQQGVPLGRVGTPADVGNLCAFLASDLAGYISGAVIPVDGGYILTQSAGDSAFPSMG